MAKLNKEEAFRLFDQGIPPLQLKGRGLKLSTLYTYYDIWKKEGEHDYPPDEIESSASTKVSSAASTAKAASILRGKIKPIEVEIDSRLFLLYNWCVAITGWKGSFSQWLFDCILDYHVLNKDKLQLEKLFEVNHE